MKTIGMLGGMSWASTQLYYQLINEGVRDQLGGLHSAQILLYSANFHDIAEMQNQNRWGDAAKALGEASLKLEQAGAEVLLICTNTMHKVADFIAVKLNIPLLHIADATASQLKNDAIQTVGLLATKFTMEEDFYTSRLEQSHGINVLVPDAHQRDRVHEIIYSELCQGMIKAESRQTYLAIINDLVNKGAEAIILGCTEITLLIQQDHTSTPLYDTTAIHAQAAVHTALS